jgi:hypothetical protein
MPRPQPRLTFIVPKALESDEHVAPKTVREPAPFVIVPPSMVIVDERESSLESHWLPTIDAATD